MTTISLRMDDEMKKELDEMCEAMGMNISTFYMVYTKKALSAEGEVVFVVDDKVLRQFSLHLASCLGTLTIGRTHLPSVKASTDTSGPVRNSSTTI